MRLQEITILMTENSDGKTNNVIYLKVLLCSPDWQLFMENQV